MMRKGFVLGIVVLFIGISIISSTATNTTTDIERKESPLFCIRTNQVLREKIGDLITKYIGERVFFLPFQLLKYKESLSLRHRMGEKSTSCGPTTCAITFVK